MNERNITDQIEFPALAASLTENQLKVLTLIWTKYIETGNAFSSRSLQHALGKIPIKDTIAGISGSLLFECMNQSTRGFRITLLGAMVAEHGHENLSLFVRLLALIKRMYEADADIKDLKSTVANKELGLTSSDQQRLLAGLLTIGLPNACPIFVSGWTPDGSWTAQITDHVVDLYNADDLERYARDLIFNQYDQNNPWSLEERQKTAFNSYSNSWVSAIDISGGILPNHQEITSSLAFQNGHLPFVDRNRLDELRAISSTKFDLSRLVAMCAELSICYEREAVHATIMLVRAILDHVPPIFGYKSFKEVANNYSGSRSFKDAMDHLEGSCRKIADMYLHSQIQKSVSLPNLIQVNFSPALDLLLAEIIIVVRDKVTSS